MEPEIRFSYNIEKFRGRRLLAKSPKKPEYVPPEKVDPAATDLKLLGMIIAPIVILCAAWFGWDKIKSMWAKFRSKEPEHEATS
jgi:hypothetical protein